MYVGFNKNSTSLFSSELKCIELRILAFCKSIYYSQIYLSYKYKVQKPPSPFGTTSSTVNIPFNISLIFPVHLSEAGIVLLLKSPLDAMMFLQGNSVITWLRCFMRTRSIVLTIIWAKKWFRI